MTSLVKIRKNIHIGQFVSIYENIKIGKNVRIEDDAKTLLRVIIC